MASDELNECSASPVTHKSPLWAPLTVGRCHTGKAPWPPVPRTWDGCAPEGGKTQQHSKCTLLVSQKSHV